jgi:hypothetical protein
VVTGFLLMAVAAFAAMSWVPTTYQASGQVLLLLPSEATGAKTPTNPYLNLQDGLTMTASLVAGTLTTKDTQRELGGGGFTSEYAVALNPGGGPLLLITTKDTDPDEAMATRDALITRVAGELQRMQRSVDVPRSQWMHTSTNALGERAEALPGSKMRALMVILAAGVTVTLVGAFVLDRLRSGPRRPGSQEMEQSWYLRPAPQEDRGVAQR